MQAPPSDKSEGGFSDNNAKWLKPKKSHAAPVAVFGDEDDTEEEDFQDATSDHEGLNGPADLLASDDEGSLDDDFGLEGDEFGGSEEDNENAGSSEEGDSDEELEVERQASAIDRKRCVLNLKGMCSALLLDPVARCAL